MNPNKNISFLHSSIPSTYVYNSTTSSSNLSKIQFLRQYEVPLNDVSTEIAKSSTAMKKQSLNEQQDITERQMIIDKMQTTLWKLGSLKDVLYNAIYFMDIIIESHSKESKAIIRLEEIAMGSLFLSIKFHQYCERIPPLRTIQMVFDPNYYYSKDQLKLIELFCLKRTNYYLSVCSPFAALEFIILRGIIFPSDNLKESFKIIQLKLVTYSREILKKIVKKANEYIKYNQLHFALGIICYSRDKKKITKWNEGFEFLYNITLDKIQNTLDFINKALTEKKSQAINTYYIERNHKTKSHIKDQASSSIKDMRQTTQYQTNTIESYRKKSQRSTSASLDETTLIKQMRIKTQQRRYNLCSIFYRKNDNSKSYKNSSNILNDLNNKYIQLKNDEESYRKEYNETISIKENLQKKSIINTNINKSMILNQSIRPSYNKLSLVFDNTRQLKLKTSRLQNKKSNLNKLLFQIECIRKIESSKDKPIKKALNKITTKPKEGISLKMIKEALRAAQTQRKIKKRLTSSLTLIEIHGIKKETNNKFIKRKTCPEIR